LLHGGDNIDLEELAKGFNGVSGGSHNVRTYPTIKYRRDSNIMQAKFSFP
jgi:hypothetical protein